MSLFQSGMGSREIQLAVSLAAILAVVVLFLWITHRFQQNTYKKYLARAQTQSDNYLAQAKELNARGLEISEQMLLELKAIRSLMEKKG